MVGSPLDYYQWAALLKSLSGFEAFRRRYHAGLRPIDVAEFVILERRLPALAALRGRPHGAGAGLDRRRGQTRPPRAAVGALSELLEKSTAESVFEQGLHEFLGAFLDGVSELHGPFAREYFEAYLGDARALRDRARDALRFAAAGARAPLRAAPRAARRRVRRRGPRCAIAVDPTRSCASTSTASATACTAST